MPDHRPENTPNLKKIKQWLSELTQSDPSVREQASMALWHLWFHQKGVYGARQLMQAESLLQTGHADKAETLLNDIIQAQPDFAEAWNRRAVLHYTQSHYQKAITDCQKTIQLVPHHFGALHGLGLCHSALGNYVAAIQAFRKASEIQPYALNNQRMILECTAKLSDTQP